MVWQKCKVLEVRYNKPYIDSHLINPIISLGLYALCITLNETTLVSEIPCWSILYGNRFLRFQHLWCTLAALIPAVAEPPELSRLKCAGHHHKGNTDTNALQTEQFLVCRVASRYNHRFSDRTSIPRTKASPEILQPQVLHHRQGKDYNMIQSTYYKTKLCKTVIQALRVKLQS